MSARRCRLGLARQADLVRVVLLTPSVFDDGNTTTETEAAASRLRLHSPLSRDGANAVRCIVSIVGPECTGKTALARALGEHFAVGYVAEVARDYLAGRTAYGPADVEAIARGQMALEARALATQESPVILDTDLLVIRVWWREKYGALPDWLRLAFAAQPPRRYLLTAPDLPWEPDPLRESPFDRERLFEVYRATLAEERLRFDVVRGTGDARLRRALAALEQNA